MKGLQGLGAKLSGWTVSLALHALILGFAALSVFSVQANGGSGWGTGGGAAGGGGGPDTYEGTVRSDEVVSGERVGDPEQYGHLTDESIAETPVEELPEQTTPPFDVFAVGSSDVVPPAEKTPPVTDPQNSRATAADRGAKLPAGSSKEGPGTEEDSPAGTAKDAGTGGPGGSGGGDQGGEGKGQGTGIGDGNATEVYTPAPAYPSDARRRNIQGIVVVELAIAADGTCAVQKVVESSGCDSLDHAVTATVSHWKYRNAEDDHRPDPMTKRVRFVFKLGDKDR